MIVEKVFKIIPIVFTKTKLFFMFLAFVSSGDLDNDFL